MSRMDRILADPMDPGRLCREDLEFILGLEQLPDELLQTTSQLRNRFSGGVIRFYHPLPRFPSVSVTGTRCELNCPHCSGKYLSQMIAASSPAELYDVCKSLDQKDGTGCLISGGSDRKGCVPLDPFYRTMERVKAETDLILNVHTGLIDEAGADKLASTGIDLVCTDLIGSSQTISRVLGLSATPEDYLNSIKYLRDSGVPTVVPHICVGLDWGMVGGEAQALHMLTDSDPGIVVILALRPTKGTPMAMSKAPSPLMVAKTVACARLAFPSSSIALGCMRPNAQRKSMEKLVILSGADRLVLPTSTTLRWAAEQGLEAVHLDACCAVPARLESMTLGRR